MKTIIRPLIFILIILFSGSCMTLRKQPEPANSVSHLTDTAVLRNGTIVYGLPLTVFTVRVEMERIIEIPGPYARYAGDLLGLTEVISSEEESWTIESIAVNSHEEVDPSELYVIEANTLFQTNILAMKKEGLILDLNPESYHRERPQKESDEISINQFMSYDLGADEYYQVQSDTAYKRVSVDSSFVRIPYLVEKKKKLSVEQLAERAARRLMELREGKIMILTGEANVFPQDASSIKEINRLEKEYTELFTGKTITQHRTYTFQIIPKKESSGTPVTVFRFSEVSGPVVATSQTGTPVLIEFIPEQKTKDLTILSRQQPVPSDVTIDKLFYRIPDVVNIRITMDSEILYNSRKLVYQFGEVLQLPENYLLGK
ncbi:MAG: DUF4831 family protein [Bacteroidales bacterium]|nr:DUF4831 family protein [Bacteroidales bacterium]